MTLRVADLEVLFTADTKDVEKAEAQVKKVGKDIESKPITAKVTADERSALAGMDRVEQAAKRLVSHATAVQIDANISRAEKGVERVSARLEYLRSVENELDVSADIKRAEANLQKLERQRDALTRSRATIEVDADTIPAQEALDGIGDAAGESGTNGGMKLAKGIIAGLAAIPILGAVAKIGEAAGEALREGFTSALGQEKSRDRLQGLTGVDEATARRVAWGAGEAYADVFGDSIEQNMDTARLGLQFRILDPGATARDAQKTIENLAGIADALEEDVRPVAATVATLLSSGVSNSAQEAYDLIAAGATNGLNRNEDLLDTLTEYPALFKRLGLTGPQALGLISQSLKAGARNTDLAADALKEFQIQATDGSDASYDAFKLLGLNAHDMTEQIAKGGDSARKGLDLVLDKLRETEDPVLRNAAAVGLFGTQAEDLGEALFAMDLSSAVDQLGQVEGAAQRLFDTLGDNDATKLEGAQRNIDVAVQGIQGALATAFTEPLGEFASWVSENRGELMQFLLDLANGALDFGEAVVIAAADGTEAFGTFVAGPLADAIEGFKHIIKVMNPLADTSDLEGLINDMRDFDEESAGAADSIRNSLLPGIEDARTKLNEFGQGAVDVAKVHDAALRTADAIAAVGTAQDGSKASAAELTDQVRSTLAAMNDELNAAERAGESQENLAQRYTTSKDALLGQLEAMGMTREEAQLLIDTVNATPERKVTEFDSNTAAEQEKVQLLAERIETLPDGSVVVHADTSTAQAKIDAIRAQLGSFGFINTTVGPVKDGYQNLPGSGYLSSNGKTFAHGAIVEFMANGGLTPMAPVAQMVPPNTWRVVGDRSDVAEAYIPLDGSPRSMAILTETIRRMGGMPMATGGIVATRGAGGAPVVNLGGVHFEGTNLSPAELVALITRVVRDVLNQQHGNGGGL